MLKLVFLACMATAPTDCEERSITIYDAVSPMACLVKAPATLAQWRETHPSWRVGRWHCDDPRRPVASATR